MCSSRISILVLAALMAACSALAQGPPGGAMPPPQVTAVPAEMATVPLAYEYVGMTEASKVVEVHARIQGFIETRDFEEGALIQEGARLYSIDPRSYKADREIAAAQVEQAEAKRRLAEQEIKRLRAVRDPGAVAATDLDQKSADLANAEAALRLAKGQLAKAELELSYTTVKAPLTGLIGKTQKEIGSLVDSAQNSLLVTMKKVDPLYVSFKVSESDYLACREDEKNKTILLEDGVTEPYLEMTFLDGSTYPKRGRINFEDASVQPQTGTVEFRGIFENAANVLKPGQFVKVRLKGWQRPNTLTVPQRAVEQSPQGAFVYVLAEGNKAERRAIKTGSWAEKDWIVLDGLKAGEKVIVEGLTKVRPGITVSTEAPPGPQGPAGAPAAKAQ